jgi:GMP synthase (glutamine-hydrolysing)
MMSLINLQERLNGSENNRMVTIHVIDNGGQWTHREWRVLKYLDVETKIIPNTADFSEVKGVDGLVLSGGSPRIGIETSLGNCASFLKHADFPILGICAGHQFMARFFGGVAKPSKIPEFGKVKLTIIKQGCPLLDDVAESSIVWESHNDEVAQLPDSFDRYAESQNCAIQVMQHHDKPFFGLQFHPEVEHTEYGVQIFKNFISLCQE